MDIVISYTDEVTTSCTGDDDTPEGSGTLERTFSVTATDCGGNISTAEHVQNINFFDVTAPSLTVTCPADTTIAALSDCTVDMSTDLLGLPDVDTEDHCDTDVAITITYNDDEFSNGCIGNRLFYRVFTVSVVDDCGNATSTTCQQIIQVEDVTPPVIALTCPVDYEEALGADCSWSESTGQPGVTVTDACDPYTDLHSGVCGPRYHHVVRRRRCPLGRQLLLYAHLDGNGNGCLWQRRHRDLRPGRRIARCHRSE